MKTRPSLLEGQELGIIEPGHTDSPDTTFLYVPSVDLVVAGGVVYNQCHSPSAIQNTKCYLQDFDRLQQTNGVRRRAVQPDDARLGYIVSFQQRCMI
jgi:hypothetical protein